MIIKTDAIVLKSFDFRETSRIVTFFTKDHGKIKGILKGIRKNSKKFGSHVDRFTINEIIYYHYSRSDLHLVSHCDLKQFFFAIREDYKRTIAANYVLELVDSLMPSEEVNPEVYQLMLDYLESLQTIADIDKLVHIFQIKILLLSGFSPHIDSCVKCQRPITGRARFSLSSGGLICPVCPTTETSFSLISKGTVSSILHIEQNAWVKSIRLGLTPTVKKELKYVLNNFLVYHLERPLKSSRYL